MRMGRWMDEYGTFFQKKMCRLNKQTVGPAISVACLCQRCVSVCVSSFIGKFCTGKYDRKLAIGVQCVDQVDDTLKNEWTHAMQGTHRFDDEKSGTTMLLELLNWKAEQQHGTLF